jgi:hypothetical protein
MSYFSTKHTPRNILLVGVALIILCIDFATIYSFISSDNNSRDFSYPDSLSTYNHPGLIKRVHDAKNIEDVKNAFNHFFNYENDIRTKEQIDLAIETYHSFPYIKEFGTSTAVLNHSFVGDPAADIVFEYTYPGRTPQFIDFINAGPEDSFIEPWIPDYEVTPFYFVEYYAAQGELPAEFISWIKLPSDPFIRKIEFEYPDYLREDLVVRLGVESFEDVYIRPYVDMSPSKGQFFVDNFHLELSFSKNASQNNRQSNSSQIFAFAGYEDRSWVFAPLELVYSPPVQNFVNDTALQIVFDDSIDSFELEDVNKIDIKFFDESIKLDSTKVNIVLINQFGQDICTLVRDAYVDKSFYLLVRGGDYDRDCDLEAIADGKQVINSIFDSSEMYMLSRRFVIGEMVQARVDLFDTNLEEKEVSFSQTFLFSVKSNQISSELSEFIDRRTGISFNYPTEFGPVTVRDMCNQDYFSYSFEGLENDPIFMTVTNTSKYECGGRGSFWGDGVMQVNSDYQSDCMQKQTCSVLVNKQDVSFAKDRDSHFDWGTDPTPVNHIYDTYTTNNTYSSVRLSSIRLSDNLKQEFEDVVVDSLQFLPQ